VYTGQFVRADGKWGGEPGWFERMP
jgi:hypothetical protein